MKKTKLTKRVAGNTCKIPTDRNRRKIIIVIIIVIKIMINKFNKNETIMKNEQIKQ